MLGRALGSYGGDQLPRLGGGVYELALVMSGKQLRVATMATNTQIKAMPTALMDTEFDIFYLQANIYYNFK